MTPRFEWIQADVLITGRPMVKKGTTTLYPVELEWEDMLPASPATGRVTVRMSEDEALKLANDLQNYVEDRQRARD